MVSGVQADPLPLVRAEPVAADYPRVADPSGVHRWAMAWYLWIVVGIVVELCLGSIAGQFLRGSDREISSTPKS